MSQPNPYESPEPFESPEEPLAPTASPTRRGGRFISRVVEYTIAIVLVVALMWVFTAFMITDSVRVR